jgi:hypothetical protein
MYKPSFIYNKSGESILEVMITMFIILLAVSTAFRMLNLAFLQKNLTEDRVIAINIAREGMEAVRYIRDYNWLYYGSKRRVCWNHLQDNNDSVDTGNGDGLLDNNDKECSEDGTNKFASDQLGSHTGASDTSQMEYALKQDESHWFVTRLGDSAHVIDNGDWDTLNTTNVATIEGDTADIGEKSSNSNSTIESFRLCKDNAGNNMIVSCLNSSGYSAADTTNITKFFRYVKVSYPTESYGNNPQDTTSVDYPTGSGLSYTKGQLHNKMHIIVGVKWEEAGTLQDIELSTILSDFFERSPLDIQN